MLQSLVEVLIHAQCLTVNNPDFLRAVKNTQDRIHADRPPSAGRSILTNRPSPATSNASRTNQNFVPGICGFVRAASVLSRGSNLFSSLRLGRLCMTWPFGLSPSTRQVNLLVRFETGKFRVFDRHVFFDPKRSLSLGHRLFASACQTPACFPHPTRWGTAPRMSNSDLTSILLILLLLVGLAQLLGYLFTRLR